MRIKDGWKNKSSCVEETLGCLITPWGNGPLPNTHAKHTTCKACPTAVANCYLALEWMRGGKQMHRRVNSQNFLRGKGRMRPTTATITRAYEARRTNNDGIF